MQIEVAQVKASVPGPGDPQDAVGVGLVVGAKPPRVVDDLHKLLDLGIKDARVFRVGDHQTGGPFRNGRFQRIQVGIAVLVRIQGDDLETGCLGTGSIRRMGEDRSDDLIALTRFPTRLVVGSDDRGVGVDRCRPSSGLQRKPVHPRDLFEDLLEPVHDLQDALNRFLVLQRVNVCQFGQAGQLVVDLGAVLHGAGSLPNLDVQIGPQVFL